jgi:hypothetical protein
VFTSLFLAEAPCPAVIAKYCLPLTSKVIGGAEKPDPKLIFHNSSSVMSSKGRHSAIGQGKENEPAGGRQRAAGVWIPQMDGLFDLADHWISGGQVALVAVGRTRGTADPTLALDAGGMAVNDGLAGG